MILELVWRYCCSLILHSDGRSAPSRAYYSFPSFWRPFCLSPCECTVFCSALTFSLVFYFYTFILFPSGRPLLLVAYHMFCNYFWALCLCLLGPFYVLPFFAISYPVRNFSYAMLNRIVYIMYLYMYIDFPWQENQEIFYILTDKACFISYSEYWMYCIR